jgi:hypothetical protein
MKKWLENLLNRYWIVGIIWLMLIANQTYQNKKTKQALDWQHDWQHNGELPIDRVQNARLDRLEKRFGIINTITVVPKKDSNESD